jgi:hypothetical protein
VTAGENGLVTGLVWWSEVVQFLVISGMAESKGHRYRMEMEMSCFSPAFTYPLNFCRPR